MARDIESPQLIAQWAWLLAHHMRLIAAAIQMPQYFEHRALHAAKDREQLHMTDAYHSMLPIKLRPPVARVCMFRFSQSVPETRSEIDNRFRDMSLVRTELLATLAQIAWSPRNQRRGRPLD